MDMTGMQAKAEADLRDAQARFEAARSRAVAAAADEVEAQEHVKQMTAVRDWLRQQDQPPQPPAPAEQAEGPQTQARTRFGKPIPEVALTERCFRALESFGRQASTTQIRDRLAAEGHEFTQIQVRGAMKYLAAKKPPMVETSKGTGVWRLSKAVKSATTNFTPAASAAGVSVAGANGSSIQGTAVPPERG